MQQPLQLLQVHIQMLVPIRKGNLLWQVLVCNQAYEGSDTFAAASQDLVFVAGEI